MNARTCRLKKDWLDYWHCAIAAVSNGGIIGQPSSGHIFKVDKPRKRMLLVGGERGTDCDILNRRCLDEIGWRVFENKWDEGV